MCPLEYRTKIVRMEATLPGFGTIWFDYSFIANIISLLKSKNKYRFMYDIVEYNQ